VRPYRLELIYSWRRAAQLIAPAADFHGYEIEKINRAGYELPAGRRLGLTSGW